MINKLYEKFKNFIKFNYKEIIFLIIFAFIMLYKFPFVIYKPGGSINLTERIKIEDSLPEKGSYSMNYVTVVKGTLPMILLSYVIPNWDLVKESEITIGNTDYETTFKIEKLDLKNSLFLAIYNAYTKAGEEVKIKNIKNYISIISDDANTNLKVLDEIISIDEKKLNSLKEFQDYVSTLNVDDKVILKVNENGKEKEKYAYVFDLDGDKKIGVGIIQEVEYETNPSIEIDTKSSEAGSSGGLMLTLAIYDSLLKEDLTKGKTIMGTGTIDEEGNVGEIGGIKYKMLGAQRDKADIFFVPEDNYEEAKEVYEKYDLSFELIMVKTLDDAINYLDNN